MVCVLKAWGKMSEILEKSGDFFGGKKWDHVNCVSILALHLVGVATIDEHKSFVPVFK